MELGIGLQFAQAAVSVLAGAALGLYYDLLRLPRLLFGGSVSTFLCDVLFCLGALLGLFTLGLGPGRGQLRLFMLLCTGIGFALWSFAPGRLIRRGETALAVSVKQSAQKLAFRLKQQHTHLKKMHEFFKKLFPSGRSWFTIKRNIKVTVSGGRAGQGNTDSAHGRGDKNEV